MLWRSVFFSLKNTNDTISSFDFDLFYRFCWWSFWFPERFPYTITQLSKRYNQNQNQNTLTSYYHSNLLAIPLDIPINTLFNDVQKDDPLVAPLYKFHIIRIAFGIMLPNVNDNENDNNSVNNDVVKCEWNKELWSLFYTVILYHQIIFGNIQDYIAESNLETYFIFYDEITSGELEEMSFDCLYQKLFNEADINSMINDYNQTFLLTEIS